MKDKYLRDVIFSFVFFFLLVISVNILLFPEMPGFLGLSPHPYIIVILLISGRFGLKEGLLTSLIASIILGTYIFLDLQQFFTWGVFIEKSFLITVGSFFLAALIVGEMRGFNKSYERTLVRENTELKGEKKRLNEQLEIVTQIKEELENRIIGQEETVHSLYQATKSLETLEEKDFFQALTKLTTRFTGATKVSLYMIDYSNDSIYQVAHYGWDENHTSRKKLPLYEGMFGQVLKTNLMLTIKDISDNPKQLKLWEKCPYKAYAYVPISMASVMVGILTVDDIPFLKLNVSTVRILSLITELAVPALKNIITYQDLQDMVKTDPVTEMLKYDSYLNVTEIEFKKTMRYNLDFSIVAIEIEGLSEIEEILGHDGRIEALKWISDKIKERIRNVDISGLGTRENRFLVSLPVTNTEGVLAVIDRMKQMEKITQLTPKWHKYLKFYYGAAAYHPSLEGLDKMLKMVHESLKLNMTSKYQHNEMQKQV
jgi:polysaccharide biosynthesis protein PelD